MTRVIVKDWQCAGSGDCCRAVSGVRMTYQELQAIVQYRHDQGWPDRTYQLRALNPGFVELHAAPCPLLEGTRCTVYPVRPFKCRQFQCHRVPGEAFEAGGPAGCLNLSDRFQQSRDVRRAYALNTRKAGHWALKMGWTGRET